MTAGPSGAFSAAFGPRRGVDRAARPLDRERIVPGQRFNWRFYVGDPGTGALSRWVHVLTPEHKDVRDARHIGGMSLDWWVKKMEACGPVGVDMLTHRDELSPAVAADLLAWLSDWRERLEADSAVPLQVA